MYLGEFIAARFEFISLEKLIFLAILLFGGI